MKYHNLARYIIYFAVASHGLLIAFSKPCSWHASGFPCHLLYLGSRKIVQLPKKDRQANGHKQHTHINKYFGAVTSIFRGCLFHSSFACESTEHQTQYFPTLLWITWEARCCKINWTWNENGSGSAEIASNRMQVWWTHSIWREEHHYQPSLPPHWIFCNPVTNSQVGQLWGTHFLKGCVAWFCCGAAKSWLHNYIRSGSWTAAQNLNVCNDAIAVNKRDERKRREWIKRSYKLRQGWSLDVNSYPNGTITSIKHVRNN